MDGVLINRHSQEMSKEHIRVTSMTFWMTTLTQRNQIWTNACCPNTFLRHCRYQWIYIYSIILTLKVQPLLSFSRVPQFSIKPFLSKAIMEKNKQKCHRVSNFLWPLCNFLRILSNTFYHLNATKSKSWHANLGSYFFCGICLFNNSIHENLQNL